MRQWGYIVLACVMLGPLNVRAEEDLTGLSLKELSNIKIYTASKKPEDPLKSPSATYVITADDIRQMGALTIPDALRTVPGLHVAKLSSNKWVVASRGFSGQYVTNLLVLLDGRPVYSTLFSGVFWDQIDVPMDDIKQIEVVRGPGASVWGLNAVNGVINIITKSSEDTTGKYVNVTAGDYANAITEARYGTKLDDKSSYRAYVKYRNFDSYKAIGTPGYNDAWQSGSAGFRYDSDISYRDNIEVSGQVRKSNANETLLLPTLVAPFTQEAQDEERVQGAYVLTKWQHGISDSSDLLITSYVDLSTIDLGYAKFQNRVIEVEAKNDFILNDHHDITWGVGSRVISDEIKNSEYLTYDPDHRITNFSNIFGQDKIGLINDELYLTLGGKLEYNSYSGLELQPSAKLAWTYLPNQTLWAGVSRAVRSPSRGSEDLTLLGRGTPAGYIALIGNNDAESEVLTAYEIGYKNFVRADLSFEATAFINSYDHLRTFEWQRGPFGNIAVPLDIANNGEARTVGFEINGKYQPSPRWWVNASYSYLNPQYSLNASSNDTLFTADAHKTPQNIANIRTQINLTDSVSTSHSLYTLEAMDELGIPAQYNYDANIVWQATDTLKVGLYGSSLLKDQHQEFTAPLYGSETYVPRSYFVQITLQM